MKRIQGFTLVELIVVLVVLAVVITVALPAFTAMTERNRLVNSINLLTMELQSARAQAVRHGKSVTITPIDNDWSNGWDIEITDFPDASSMGYPIERVTIEGPDFVVFEASGTSLASTAFTLQSGNSETRTICLTRMGRSEIVPAEEDCQ